MNLAWVKVHRRTSGAWELERELVAEGTANAEVVVPTDRDFLGAAESGIIDPR